MPFLALPKDEPRCQPCAYVTDGVRLFEIIEDSRGVIVIENCSTNRRWSMSRSAISKYTLVRAAPVDAPDYPSDEGLGEP